MQKFLIILLVTLAFQAHAERGFHDISDSRIPPTVASASQSVYQLFVIDPANLKKEGVAVIIHKNKYQKLKDFYLTGKNESKEEVEDRYGFLLELALLNRCIERGQDFCVMLADLSQNGIGSAFLFGDQQTIVTAAHVFDEPLRISTEMRIILVNKEAKIVFDSVDADSSYTIQKNGQNFKSLEREKSLLTDISYDDPFLHDFLVLKLSKKLNDRPLQEAPQQEGKNKMVYFLGYPGKSYNRQTHYGGPDSNGQGLKVSFGPSLSFEDYLKSESPMSKYALKQIKKQINDSSKLSLHIQMLNQLVLVSTFSDINYGMSGGPIVNEKGEVLAISILAFGLWFEGGCEQRPSDPIIGIRSWAWAQDQGVTDLNSRYPGLTLEEFDSMRKINDQSGDPRTEIAPWRPR